MGLDIWLGWPGKLAAKAKGQASGDGSPALLDSLRFTYDRSRFAPFTQTFELWAQTQLGGRGLLWILDLDDDKRVPVEEREDGSIITGTHPDWEGCQTRATEALELARAIPDRLFVVKTSRLRKPWEDYPTTSEVLDYYRREKDQKTGQFKGVPLPPHIVLEDFQTTAGVFFGEQLPKIKAALICRGGLGMELVFVCQGEEEVHQPYVRTLEVIQRFIAVGASHRAWLCWSG